MKKCTRGCPPVKPPLFKRLLGFTGCAVLVLSIYLVLVAAFTYPLLFKMNTHITGPAVDRVTVKQGSQYYFINEDAIIYVWYWWHQRANLHNYFTAPDFFWKADSLYYPEGLNVWVSLSNPYPHIAMFPLIGRYPLPFSQNLYTIVTCVLNGAFAFIMLRSLRFNGMASLLGGAFVALNPYYHYNVAAGRGEQAIIYFLLLFLPAGVGALRFGGRGRTVTAAFLLLLACLCYWFHGVFLVMFLAIAALYYSCTAPSGKKLLPVRRALVLVIILVCLSLPLLLPHLYEGLKEGHVLGVTSRNIMALKMPPKEKGPANTGGLELDERPVRGDSPLVILQNPVACFQVILLVLLVFSRKLFRKKAPRLWLLAGFLFYIFSLGPYLNVTWFEKKVFLPYALLYSVIPFMSRLIDTGRFAAVTYVVLAILTALFFTRVSERLKLHRTGRIFLLGGFLFIAVLLSRMGGSIDLKPPPEIPPGIVNLKNKKGAVIDIPLLSNEVGTRAMLYQTAHGLPMAIGPAPNVRFVPPDSFRQLITGNPLLQYLSGFGLSHEKRQKDYSLDINIIKSKGFRFIIFHKDLYQAGGGSQAGGGMQGPGNQKSSPKSAEEDPWQLTRVLVDILNRKPVYSDHLVDIFDLKQPEL